MTDYYARDGQPIDLTAWVALVEDDPEYKQVDQTRIGRYYISTVWMGIDYSFKLEPGERPIIFETMIFMSGDGVDEYGLDQRAQRYSTEEDAQRGHDAMVAFVRSVLGGRMREPSDG